MAKRKFLICFPYEGDIKKIEKIADTLDKEGVDFMQVDKETESGKYVSVAKGDIDDVKEEILDEIREEYYETQESDTSKLSTQDIYNLEEFDDFADDYIGEFIIRVYGRKGANRAQNYDTYTSFLEKWYEFEKKKKFKSRYDYDAPDTSKKFLNEQMQVIGMQLVEDNWTNPDNVDFLRKFTDKTEGGRPLLDYDTELYMKVSDDIFGKNLGWIKAHVVGYDIYTDTNTICYKISPSTYIDSSGKKFGHFIWPGDEDKPGELICDTDFRKGFVLPVEEFEASGLKELVPHTEWYIDNYGDDIGGDELPDNEKYFPKWDEFKPFVVVEDAEGSITVDEANIDPGEANALIMLGLFDDYSEDDPMFYMKWGDRNKIHKFLGRTLNYVPKDIGTFGTPVTSAVGNKVVMAVGALMNNLTKEELIEELKDFNTINNDEIYGFDESEKILIKNWLKEYVNTSGFNEIVENQKALKHKKGDFVYGYEGGMDRWLPYRVVENKGGNEYILREANLLGPGEGELVEYEGELKEQPEDRAFLIQDYFSKNEFKDFENYVKENSDLVESIDVEFNGVVNIVWKDWDKPFASTDDPVDPYENDLYLMEGYVTKASPFWTEEDRVDIQVDYFHEDGTFANTGLGDSIRFKNYTDFSVENGTYPNNPNTFYQAYVDILPEILEKSAKIVKDFKKERMTYRERDEEFVKQLHKDNEIEGPDGGSMNWKKDVLVYIDPIDKWVPGIWYYTAGSEHIIHVNRDDLLEYVDDLIPEGDEDAPDLNSIKEVNDYLNKVHGIYFDYNDEGGYGEWSIPFDFTIDDIRHPESNILNEDEIIGYSKGGSIELTPLDRKSFYGKAKIINKDGKHYLKSYNTLVAEYDPADKKMKIYDYYSHTTGRHINAFLNHFGYPTMTKSEIIANKNQSFRGGGRLGALSGGGIGYWKKDDKIIQGSDNFTKEEKKDNNRMVIGGLAGLLLGIFLLR